MDSLKCNALWRERKRLAGGIGGVAPDGQPEGCVGHDVARVAGALRAPVGASRHGKHLDVFVSAGFDNPLPAYSTCLDGLFNRHVGYYSAVAGKSFKTIISDVKHFRRLNSLRLGLRCATKSGRRCRLDRLLQRVCCWRL